MAPWFQGWGWGGAARRGVGVDEGGARRGFGETVGLGGGRYAVGAGLTGDLGWAYEGGGLAVGACGNYFARGRRGALVLLVGPAGLSRSITKVDEMSSKWPAGQTGVRAALGIRAQAVVYAYESGVVAPGPRR